jgi:hypothetical protein
MTKTTKIALAVTTVGILAAACGYGLLRTFDLSSPAWHLQRQAKTPLLKISRPTKKAPRMKTAPAGKAR